MGEGEGKEGRDGTGGSGRVGRERGEKGGRGKGKDMAPKLLLNPQSRATPLVDQSSRHTQSIITTVTTSLYNTQQMSQNHQHY